MTDRLEHSGKSVTPDIGDAQRLSAEAMGSIFLSAQGLPTRTDAVGSAATNRLPNLTIVDGGGAQRVVDSAGQSTTGATGADPSLAGAQPIEATPTGDSTTTIAGQYTAASDPLARSKYFNGPLGVQQIDYGDCFFEAP